MTASPYVREPWAGASADTWSEATSRSKDTRARRKIWRAEHRANRQGSPNRRRSEPERKEHTAEWQQGSYSSGEAKKSEDWKNHRLNPLTGEKK